MDAIVDERLPIALAQPRRVFTSLAVPHLAPELARLDCPVLALWGMSDRFCPPSGAMAIAERCRRAEVVLLTACGHWVMVERPALFNRLCLGFINE
jgi:4,5:9,10-diseco-3-hydroxy-5,9,17-trioxoandrosta-1(10),2-diene-4-oate hydrolase